MQYEGIYIVDVNSTGEDKKFKILKETAKFALANAETIIDWDDGQYLLGGFTSSLDGQKGYVASIDKNLNITSDFEFQINGLETDIQDIVKNTQGGFWAVGGAYTKETKNFTGFLALISDQSENTNEIENLNELVSE